jgi:hypothetical protein
MKAIQLGVLLAMSTTLPAQQNIPFGTIFPVQLDSTLSSRSLPGQFIKATVMQDVPLRDGAKIPAGAKVMGEVTAIDSDSTGTGLRISLKFDLLKVRQGVFPILTALRALASGLEIDAAEMPLIGGDRGTPSTAYTTVQVGGDEVVYRGGGHVMSASGVVGEPVPNGVLGRTRPNVTKGCRDQTNADDAAQALWVFASDACGVYGFDNLAILGAGREDPVGEITLLLKRKDVKIRGGSGMLLRTIGGNQ